MDRYPDYRISGLPDTIQITNLPSGLNSEYQVKSEIGFQKNIIFSMLNSKSRILI